MHLSFFGVAEPAFRLMVFVGVLLLLLAAELRWPRKKLHRGHRRWPANLGILVLGSLTVRLMGSLAAPLLAVGSALIAEQHGAGLLRWLSLPGWLSVLIGLLLLDLLIYAQHRAFHRIPLLWRIHRMHHADTDIDVTTALRFHPLEIALSMLIKVAAVWLLGVSALTVVVFEVFLNVCAMFNHANLRLPLGLDRVLRQFVVTPDMHRVHHSVDAQEHQSNFGFNLSVWDRLFKSYRAQPQAGHAAMRIGLPEFPGLQTEKLWWCLKVPFAGNR
ncbi:MAG: sterol desaturase family protein [Pseudomonadota bacterium]